MRHLVSVIAVLLVTEASGSAQPIVIEAHVHDQPSDAPRLFAPVLDELSRMGYRTGEDAVGQPYELHVSRPSRVEYLDAKGVVARLSRGVSLWIDGKFEPAIDELRDTFTDLRANPALLASEQSLRESVFRASLALAQSYQRHGDQIGARDTMADLIRSFPDMPVSRADHGPDADRLYKAVKNRLDAAGRGALTVTVSAEDANVFVNEVFVDNGGFHRGGLVPGKYRVSVQRGNNPGRVYPIEVKPNTEARLDIDWSFDAALHTSRHWVGFRFRTQDERTRRIAPFAARFSRALEADRAVVLELRKVHGVLAVTGSLYSSTGTLIRTAAVSTSPEPSAEQLRALARFLDSGRDKPPDPQPLPAATTSVSRGSGGASMGWLKWAGVAATAAGGGAAVGLFLVDGKGTTCRDDVCSDYYDTRNLGYAVLAGTAVLGATTTWLFWRDRERPQYQVGVAPTDGGVMVGGSGTF